MNNVLFNENMTSVEARNAFWDACTGKSKEERKEIFKEYEKVHYIISARETKETQDWMTSY